MSEYVKTRIHWLKKDLQYACNRFLDRYFPDKRTYVGKNFAICATENWGDSCPEADLNYDDWIAICNKKRRGASCPNRKLLETEQE